MLANRHEIRPQSSCRPNHLPFPACQRRHGPRIRRRWTQRRRPRRSRTQPGHRFARRKTGSASNPSPSPATIEAPRNPTGPATIPPGHTTRPAPVEATIPSFDSALPTAIQTLDHVAHETFSGKTGPTPEHPTHSQADALARKPPGTPRIGRSAQPASQSPRQWQPPRQTQPASHSSRRTESPR